ncbi:PilN domain-containing protein [Methylocucumis oryzae]|uniref:PilN domain-containing protein n=1 Tax=Methylocucumis oryzae TaxID=1632867 RepID=UPI0009E55972|nr:PilN domain-containing protein [Methylocucumis oryzae]
MALPRYLSWLDISKHPQQTRAIAPIVCVQQRENQLRYSVLSSSGWQALNELTQAHTGLLAKVILLLPTEYCSFKHCRFPLHLIAENELAEALQLDIAKWSPWGQQSDYVFQAQVQGDDWLVYTWVWDRENAYTLRQQLSYCTHVMPEPAWYAAQLNALPALLIGQSAHAFYYALVTASGWISQFAEVKDASQAQRYWHGWGTPEIKHCWLTQEGLNTWQPEAIDTHPLPSQGLPHSRVLNRFRLPGIKDWSDPMSYRELLSVLVVTLMLWLLSDAAVLQYRQQQTQTELQTIKQSSEQILTLKQQVKQRRQLFQYVQQLKHQQQSPEYLLAELTDKIPDAIWLESLQFQGDELDLTGRGKKIVALLPTLQQIKGVADVQLLNDIHPDAVTGEEQFQIKLLLQKP